MVTPFTSVAPSESVSHEKPEMGIWSDLLGVSDADRVTDSPTSTESKSLSLEIVGGEDRREGHRDGDSCMRGSCPRHQGPAYCPRQ